jgi:hypothetical protein
MARLVPLVPVLSALSALGCAGAGAPPARPEVPAPVAGHLLAFPHADAEGLLGREVTTTEDGGLRIADARAPGCEVLVRRIPAQFKTTRESKTSRLASIGAGYQQIVALEARFGRESLAKLELDNTSVIEGDVRGPCGARVVSKIFVGRGKRSVFAASRSSGGASVATPLGTVGPKGEARSSDADDLVWTEEQAYAFDVRELPASSEAGLAIGVKLPSIVVEGDELHVTFTSARPAWLVVYYVDGEGKGEVLWPSNEEPAPSARPGAPALLPSPSETAAGIHLRPALTKPGEKTREQLVVYAFADKRDFDVVKPAPGSSSAAGAAFADEIARKLRDVPASRWSKTVLHYTIEPRK